IGIHSGAGNARREAANPWRRTVRPWAARLLSGCALLLATAASVPAQMQAGVPTNFVLAAGDVIRIEVWRNKELSGDFPIAADGSITHPLYRELKVAGVPLPTVEQQVRTFLSRYESNPSFVLFPL